MTVTFCYFHIITCSAKFSDNGWSIGMDRDGMYIDGPPPGMLDGDANMSDQEDWYSWFHGITNNGREVRTHKNTKD